jgi:hypothetical protein|eukprot:COSAG02_NODE_2733_length_8136_cov_35.604454_5_plen_77_part_00
MLIRVSTQMVMSEMAVPFSNPAVGATSGTPKERSYPALEGGVPAVAPQDRTVSFTVIIIDKCSSINWNHLASLYSV